MTIAESVKQLTEQFSILENWSQKYEFLIDLSSELPEMESKLKTPQNLLAACSSRAWLVVEKESQNNLLEIKAASDSLIIKGFLAIFWKICNLRSASEIRDLKFQFLEEIGFKNYLSLNRAYGLQKIYEKIQKTASEYAGNQ